MNRDSSPLKWRHPAPDLVLPCTRMDCRCPPGHRDLEGMVRERGPAAVGRRWRVMQCFRSFHSAERAIEGIEALHILRKGQVKRIDGRDTIGQARFVESLFGIAA